MPKGYETRTKPTVRDGIVLDEGVLEEPYETRIVEYQPGNGTRYVLVITELADMFSDERVRHVLGTGDKCTTYLVTRLIAGSGRSMLVGGVDHFLHYQSVAEKLGVGVADAVVLAELIGELLDLRHYTCEQFEALDNA